MRNLALFPSDVLERSTKHKFYWAVVQSHLAGDCLKRCLNWNGSKRWGKRGVAEADKGCLVNSMQPCMVVCLVLREGGAHREASVWDECTMRPFSQGWAAVLFENGERGGRTPRTGNDSSLGAPGNELHVNLGKRKKHNEPPRGVLHAFVRRWLVALLCSIVV